MRREHGAMTLAMRTVAGFSYLEVLVAMAIALVVSVSSFFALTNGTRLSEAMHARIALLTIGQAEMEHLLGVPFDRLEGYPIETADAAGSVTVDTLTPRRKRITVFLRHLRAPNQTLALVTYDHQQGITR